LVDEIKEISTKLENKNNDLIEMENELPKDNNGKFIKNSEH
jgi:hypothetical protein